MYKLIYNKMGRNINNSRNKFRDIKLLFEKMEIQDEYVIYKSKEPKRLYIFEITPITLIEIKDEEIKSIFNAYKGFLRQAEYEFQIIIRSSKFNINKYFEMLNNYNKGDNVIDFYHEYINDLEVMLIKENIYKRNIYIVVGIPVNQKNIEHATNFKHFFTNIEDIGCHVKPIKGIEEMESLMYEFLNKEVIK